MPTFVQTDVDDGVAIVTLHDPDRRNAINATMNHELVATFDDLEARDDVGAVVVTGTPPAFCAGADLDELAKAGEASDLRPLYTGFLRVADSTLPTVAAVNGAAVGAGLNMALACDVIVAGESARFESRFLKLGIHPGGGHTWRVARVAGDQVARAMVLFNEVLDGRRAAEVGLAWRCVADDELLTGSVELARTASRVPANLMARAKATIASLPAIETGDDAVTLEVEPQAWSARQPAFEELLAKVKASLGSRKR